MKRINRFKKKLLTFLFYGSIGLIASLILSLIFYWSLSLNSSIYSLINNTKSEPLYLWSYAVLTFGTIFLFGVNTALFVYHLRKFGPPKLTAAGGNSLGALVGVAASACPVCGSLLLSAIGVAGGLATFPLQGLELKALSFGLMALPVWLTTRELKKLGCGGKNCPVPHPTSFGAKDAPYLLVTFTLIAILTMTLWDMLKTDPIFFNLNDNKLNSAEVEQGMACKG